MPAFDSADPATWQGYKPEDKTSWPGYIKGKRAAEKLAKSTADVDASHRRYSSITPYDGTLSPWFGCQKIAPGCRECYLWRPFFTERLKWDPDALRYFDTNGLTSTLREWIANRDENGEPKFAEIRRIFWQDLGDFGDERVPDAYKDAYHEIFFRAFPQIQWRTSTKRATSLRSYYERRTAMFDAMHRSDPPIPRNLMLGVSVCYKGDLKNLEVLQSLQPKGYFVSVEPLIRDLGEDFTLKGAGLIVVGGESGKNSRPMKKEWVDNLWDVAKRDKATSKWHFKQRGSTLGRQGAGGPLCTHCDRVHWNIPPKPKGKAVVA